MSATEFDKRADADDAEREAKLNGAGPPMIEDEDGDLVDALTYARKKLNLPELRRLVKYSNEAPTFDIELDDGRRFPVGGTKQLRKQEVVTDLIADATDKYPPAFTAAKFRHVANALRAIAELEDTGAGPKDQTRIWIAQFCQHRHHTVDLNDPDWRGEAVQPREGRTRFDGDGSRWEAFTADGCLHLRAPALDSYLRNVQHVRITYPELTARLGRLGFTNEKMTAPRVEGGDGKKRQPQRRYWRSPRGYDWNAEA